MIKGKTFYDKEYWIFALKFNIPLIPHYLSLIILGQSDRIMVQKMCGDGDAGVYGFGYQIASVMTVLIGSINGARVPWTYEQLRDKTYIISELFLLGLHLMMIEQQKLQSLVQEKPPCTDGTAQSAEADDPPRTRHAAIAQLTQTERIIFDAYLRRMTTKEIMALLNIKENTLKFHNKNLYQKLGVSSRKELQEIYSQADAETIPHTPQDTV